MPIGWPNMASSWTFRLYRRRSRDPKQAYGWQLIAPNGRKVAASSEGFASRRNAQRNADLTARALAALG